ncbi:MAG: hypothetical protein IPP16_21360 [Acidimicrobiaceae bacterium]|nr:hypothetical protein [Acidimicrobiaceae bacterium]
MNQDGTCHVRPRGAGPQQPITAKNLDLQARRRRGRRRRRQKARRGIKVLMALSRLYLGWRVVQLFGSAVVHGAQLF